MAARNKEDGANYDEDLDEIDFNNYKGMFFNDDPGQKYQDEVTGAHFEYRDMCKRLKRLQIEAQSLVPTGSTDDIPSNNPKDLNDTDAHRVVNESGQAIQALQALLAMGQFKEGRNGVQTLPQQGYGTVGAHYKEPVKSSVIDAKNFRQFSSQLEQPGKLHSTDKASVNQPPNRSKSIDKQHPLAPKTNNCPLHPGAMLIKPASKPGPNPTKNSRNVKRETFYDLYPLQFTQHRQKNIEQLLEDKTRLNPKCRPNTNHQLIKPRTKTINLGLEKTGTKAGIENAKSRNAASRTQDRKTFEVKLEPKGEKREDGFGKFSYLYQTTAEKPPEKKSLSKSHAQHVVEKRGDIAVKKDAGRGKIVIPASDKLKKLKVSLIGTDFASCYSRNVIPTKTSIRESAKEKVSQPVRKIQGQQPYHGSKRAYVASLLQPSATMKK